MIKWIKYDPANPPEHWKTFLITKGKKVDVAYLDTDKTNGLQWWEADTDEELMHIGVTHYAHINLPGEEKEELQIKHRNQIEVSTTLEYGGRLPKRERIGEKAQVYFEKTEIGQPVQAYYRLDKLEVIK